MIDGTAKGILQTIKGSFSKHEIPLDHVFGLTSDTMNVSTKQPKLTFKKESTDNKKKDEARVALFTAMRTSIRTVDHLGEVINYSHEKEINKMQMH
ncbi:unnamed protein product [Parnassius apollo]|uniref:(apollo) hypothetical protein n=1 Tax=Parnassius apollo TaxID=110799 RepID=A0A8S3WQ01_PARAO|nr:unnamed protein product [Parnassius apollo]